MYCTIYQELFQLYSESNADLIPVHLAMRRHVHGCLGRKSIFAPPQAGYCLLLCVKLQPWLAIECVGTATRNRLLVAGEGEHGEL
jgi:hypothetical protein